MCKSAVLGLIPDRVISWLVLLFGFSFIDILSHAFQLLPTQRSGRQAQFPK